MNNLSAENFAACSRFGMWTRAPELWVCSIAKELGGAVTQKRHASMIRPPQLSLDQWELKMLIPLHSLLAQAGTEKLLFMPIDQVLWTNIDSSIMVLVLLEEFV
jgi:hypothetical protein